MHLETYGVLKLKNPLVKAVFCVTVHTVCSLVAVRVRWILRVPHGDKSSGLRSRSAAL
jgi:hypothetical protein